MKKFLIILTLLASSACVPAHFEASATWGEHIRLDKQTHIAPTKYEESKPSVNIITNDLENDE